MSDKRRIGNSELEVNAVGLGCMGFSHAYGAPTERKEATNMIRKAFDYGYDFFDTAECYIGTNADGSTSFNEELVGEALKDVRKHIVVASKFGVQHSDTGLVMDSRPETIRSAVEGSLKRLGIETIDLYYQHRIDPRVEPETVLVIQIDRFNPQALTKYGKDSKFDAGTDYRSHMPQYTEEGFAAAEELMNLLQGMADEKGATTGQISLAWMLCKKPYIILIPGSRKEDRIKENIGAAKIVMTTEEIEQIDSLLDRMDMPVYGQKR